MFRNKTIIQTSRNLFLILIIAVITGFGGLCATALIPQKPVMEHIHESAQYLHEQGLYADLLGLRQGTSFNLDGYTDAIMLNEAAHIDCSDVLHSAVNNNIFTRHDKNGYSRIDDLDYICKNGTSQDGTYSYGRYWHGYITLLRPLLGGFNYNDIRTINIILLSLLTLLIIVLAQITIGESMAFAFGLTLIFAIFPVVPLSLQFTSVFYIAFLGVAILLLFPKVVCKNPFPYFFILGICTSYFDLLTAPMVTICYPLLFYLSMVKKDFTSIQIINKTILLVIVWGIGYGGFWMTKWVIGYLLTGEEFIRNAFMQVGLRTHAEISPLNILTMIVRFISSIPVIWILCVSLIYFVIRFEKSKVHNNSWLLVLAIIPVFWLTILNNHTYYHIWFAWRNLLPSVTCLLYFFFSSTSFTSNIKKRLSL